MVFYRALTLNRTLIGGLIFLVTLTHGGQTQAIPQCEGISTSSVSQVKACIGNIPQIKSSMPQITDVVTGCQFAKLFFKSAAGPRATSIPACSVFAKAIYIMEYLTRMIHHGLIPLSPMDAIQLFIRSLPSFLR